VAARETADLIHSRVECTERATKVTDKLGTALHDIVVDTKKVTDLAGEIAAGSQEQADGTGQLSKATTQMDQVTQNNAATAEELASSSEELSAQAKSLEDRSAQAKSLEDRIYDLAKEIGIENTDSDKSESIYRHANRDQETYRKNTVRPKNNKSRHAEDEDTIIFDVKKKNNGHRKFNREKVNHNRQISDEVIPMDDFKGF
ncbi:MAG: mcp, partial [Candidatus Brocadiaceae bacterium]|nr:mcp [Candidatus Brocadiaceae bacterium]